jgi:hypothetical protein
MRRSVGVHGANYVVHLRGPDGVLTRCGRVTSRVNVFTPPGDDGAEEICRSCRAACPTASGTAKDGGRE